MDQDSIRVPVFRELTVLDAGSRFDDLGAAIESRLTPPWSRDTERESDTGLGGIEYLVFRRAPAADRPAVGLFMTTRGNDVYIANIVPAEVGQISKDEYNRTVYEFAEAYAMPAAHELAVEVQLGDDYIDLAELLDNETYRALRAFSQGANRSTGSSHPADRERWFAFIWRLHSSGVSLSPDLLEQWLERDGWTEEAARELSIEFEFAIELLRHGHHG